jgi:hypothetical protein
MASAPEEDGRLKVLAVRSLIPLLALVIVGATYFLWPLDRVGTTERCVGTHLFTRATLDSSGYLNLHARTGYRPRRLKIGPDCPWFSPQFEATSEDDMNRVCVGDPVSRFGAATDAAACTVQEIRVVRQIGS